MCSPMVLGYVESVGGGGAGDEPGAPGVSLGREVRFGRVHDLTHTNSEDFPLFPAFEAAPVRIEPLFTYERDGFRVNAISMAEHSGTHLDAPCHFSRDGIFAEAIPVASLFAPLAVIDISGRAEKDPDTLLTPDDVLVWERRHGPLPEGTAVVLHSGWERRLPDAAAFLNRGDDGFLHFPGFSPDAARFLVDERNIVGAGTDTLSLDAGTSLDFGAHAQFLPAGKWGLENLARLGEVPPAGATLIVGGPKHRPATGGPARVFAVI